MSILKNKLSARSAQMKPGPNSIWSLETLWLSTLVLAQYCSLPVQSYHDKQDALYQLDAFNTTICGRRRISLPKNHAAERIIRHRQHIINRQMPLDWPAKRRLSAGWESIEGEFPWYVFVETKIKINSIARYGTCGGVIIHRNLILTAAHCVYEMRDDQIYNPESITVMASFTSRHHRTQPTQTVLVSGSCVPKDYVFTREVVGQLGHDIALLRLETPLEYNDFVQPACLHKFEHSTTNEWAQKQNKNCFLAGFGNIRQDPTAVPADSLRVLPERPCTGQESAVKRLDESCFITLDQTKYPGSTCSGDSGSALYCKEHKQGHGERFYAVGVVSHGPPACNYNEITVTYLSDFYLQRENIEKLIATCGREENVFV